jgi:DNA polymerase V
MEESIEIFGFQRKDCPKIPLYLMSVSAGKPIPVDEEIEREIDLNEFLVEHPASTFFARIRGSHLSFAGISDGDILIIDTSVDPKDGKLVLVSVENELTVKIYREIDGGIFLESHSHQFLPLNMGDLLEFKLMGVITRVIHSF